MRLLANRLLVRQIPPAQKTDSGLYRPMAYQDDRQQYEVLEVGPGRRLKNGELVPLEVAPGDRILAPQYHGHLADLGDGRFIINDSEILAVWPGPGKKHD